jgi:hypothetical protein
MQLKRELSLILEKQNAEARQRQIAYANKQAFKKAQLVQKGYKDQDKWITAYKTYFKVIHRACIRNKPNL